MLANVMLGRYLVAHLLTGLVLQVDRSLPERPRDIQH